MRRKKVNFETCKIQTRIRCTRADVFAEILVRDFAEEEEEAIAINIPEDKLSSLPKTRVVA